MEYPSARFPVNETWFISGASASGKSSFVMQLAKELCKLRNRPYLSYEEGVSRSFQERLPARADERGSRPLPHCSGDSYADLVERLRRPKSAKFVIIDSFQDSKLTFEEVEELIARFHRKSFIFHARNTRDSLWASPQADSAKGD